MNELLQQLKDKAGLTDEQAANAIKVMKEFVQGKVPPMFSGFVDTFFADTNKGSAEDSFLH